MRAEELIEASKDLLVNLQDEPSKYVTQAPECISQLLALFGEQSEQIKKLRAELTGCSPNMAQFVATPRHLPRPEGRGVPLRKKSGGVWQGDSSP